jgi:tetratricopeptide (TPR) repeat protein
MGARVLFWMLLTIQIASAQGIDLAKQGDTARLSGNYEQARQAYDAALKSNDLDRTQRSQVLWKLGSVTARTGEYVEAEKYFTRSIETEANFAAFGLRAYVRDLMGRYDLAEKDYNQAEALVPTNTRPWIQGIRADHFRRLKKYEKALELATAAVNADYTGGYFRRAWIYMDMKKYADAKRDLAKLEEHLKEKPGFVHGMWNDEKAALARLRELK